MPKLPSERPYASPNYSLNARLEFCKDTGFSSPEFVVKAGRKTVEQWSETLNKHRPTNTPKQEVAS